MKALAGSSPSKLVLFLILIIPLPQSDLKRREFAYRDLLDLLTANNARNAAFGRIAPATLDA